KSRYMERLGLLIPNFTPTTAKSEKKNPKQADELYMSASNYLREHTRNTTRYPLIFKENIAYGFSRNIRAFKSLGIFIAASSLAGSLAAIYLGLPDIERMSVQDIVLAVPFAHLGLIAIHLAMLWVWTFLVTEKWVRIRAFAYA